jgi:crotonyl-CoA carboxylase/reductase
VARDLFEIGDLPPLGFVPDLMYASVIRQERYGQPCTAFRTEVVPVPSLPPGHVLVLVMAAGVNFNNVWAALGDPADVIAARQKQGQPEDFHIGGSDGSGIVWAVGESVTSVRVGDHVIMSACRWDESAEDIRMGADPMTSVTQRVWGYEDNHGSFAQFTVVTEYQCIPKPPNLNWTQAAAFLLTSATAYRQLTGWPPHTVRPGDPVLVWGGAGGLGSMAVQIVRILGGIPVAVTSTEEKAEFCRGLGALTLLRTDFDHWGRMPDTTDGPAFDQWFAGVRAFGRRFWEVLGERRAPRIVLEHPGRDTLPTSMYLCDNAGMVVLCGATTGFLADVDLRFLWMRQKRLQGSHFANIRQCRAVVHLAGTGQLDPCLSLVEPFDRIGHAHQLLLENRQPPGNIAVLVGATAGGDRMHSS